YAKHTLGRFRLSLTSDPPAFERDQKRFAVLKAADPWLKLAAACALNGRQREAVQYFVRALQRTEGYEAKKPIVRPAAAFADVLASRSRAKARDSQRQLAWAGKLVERGRELLAGKQPAQAQAELQKSRDIFLRLRDNMSWTVLTPTEWKATGGEQFAVESD